jgi:tetratricopeptide (TPR) repeat protein
MKQIHTALLSLTLGLSLAACKSNSLGHRDPNTNPDELLAGVMNEYEKSLGGHTEGLTSGHVLVDAHRAQNELERLLLDYPRNVNILMANAVVAYDTKQPAKAQGFLNRILGLQPACPDAAILECRILAEEGNLPTARRILEDQVHLTPDHAGLRETYSSVLFLLGDLPGASRELDIAERLGSPAWRIAFNRGLIAEKRGDGARAQKEYELALAGNPDFKPAQSRLAGKKAESGYNKAPSPPGNTGGF